MNNSILINKSFPNKYKSSNEYNYSNEYNSSNK